MYDHITASYSFVKIPGSHEVRFEQFEPLSCAIHGQEVCYTFA